jgi:hypothetical protein
MYILFIYIYTYIYHRFISICMYTCIYIDIRFMYSCTHVGCADAIMHVVGALGNTDSANTDICNPDIRNLDDNMRIRNDSVTSRCLVIKNPKMKSKVCICI